MNLQDMNMNSHADYEYERNFFEVVSAALAYPLEPLVLCHKVRRIIARASVASVALPVGLASTATTRHVNGQLAYENSQVLKSDSQTRAS
jgi:hypothetical protein